RARIAQSSALPTVADEPASLVRDVSEEEACHTESGFIADQDRATIAKTSTLPHDSAPKVTSPAADEGTKVLTSIDAATVLAGGIEVPTGSGSIPTVGPPATVISTGSEVGPTASPIVGTTASPIVGTTASPIVTSYLRRNGKEVMVESDTPKK
nr:hypothetical protein [Tanacetum cinerariifolium]